ncbi:MAG: DUF4339 domain-containing protein [Sandaracinaceae bacterium]|nr:DUF4339 domain-containing protein [Sandaracinaceae bacterium]
MRWYINRTGNAEGPFDEPTILGMIGRGEVQPHHQICVEGQQAWQPLTSHPPFANPPPAAGGGGGFGQPPAQGGFGQPPAQDFGAAANQAANQFGAAANDAANQFGGAANALAAGQAPGFTSSAAAGEGFFEQAKARNEPISEEAKKAAGMAHLLGAGGVFLGCWLCGLGGVAGSFLGNVLYKEQPKSAFAQFHINQAVQFQLAVWGTNIVVAILSNVLSFVGSMIHAYVGMAFSALSLINLVLFAAAVILPFLQYGKAKNGEWSEYPVIGARVMRAKSPMIK